jgi:hypothetical protein
MHRDRVRDRVRETAKKGNQLSSFDMREGCDSRKGVLANGYRKTSRGQLSNATTAAPRGAG